MNFSLSIAARLKEERSRLKLSQEKLASIAGITRQTQSKYEKGARQPDSLYLHAIAQSQFDVNYILTGQRINPNSAQTAQQITIADSTAEYTKEQHHEYDNPKTAMESNNYIKIPSIPAQQSAQFPHGPLLFETNWLNQHFNCTHKSMFSVIVEEDGTEPNIRIGDIVLINNDHKLEQLDGLFVIKMNDHQIIRRLQHLPDNQVNISCDNTNYDPFIISADKLQENKQVIGKVIWHGHTL